ncbi:hypothetical protein M0805_002148 [Coniferiporia weirii]|nr:hypothetical protein M0805_002148 [Coniferiporia weirii]
MLTGPAAHSPPILSPPRASAYTYTRPAGGSLDASWLQPQLQQGFMHHPSDFRNPEPHHYSPGASSAYPPFGGAPQEMTAFVQPSQLSEPQQQQQQHSIPPYHPQATLTSLATVGDTMTLAQNHEHGSTPSPASSIHQQAADFSRRAEGSSGSSPKRSASDAAFNCRTPNSSGRQRTGQACEKCRDRKTKCSGTRPTCKRCADRGLACVWAPETRVRGTQRQQQRHRRPESSDRAVDPSPFFISTNPLHDEVAHSAPPVHRAFHHLDLPDTPLASEHGVPIKRVSLPEEELRGMANGYVNRGPNALHVMGLPVRPLNSVDDCWDAVNTAPLATPGWERIVNTTRMRERRPSISVAHLARNRALQGEPRAQYHTPVYQLTPVSYFNFNRGHAASVPYLNGDSSGGSSPHPFGGSQPTTSSDVSDNELPASYTDFHMMQQQQQEQQQQQQQQQYPMEGDHEPQQPFPEYDALCNRTEGMMYGIPDPEAHASQGHYIPEGQGVHVGAGNSFGAFEHAPADAFAQAAQENGLGNSSAESDDQITPTDHTNAGPAPPPPRMQEDEFISQYMHADAFDPRMHM